MDKKEIIKNVFMKYIDQKGYHYSEKEESHSLRLDVSDLKNKAVIQIYNTGRIVIQGKASPLKDELEKFKAEFEQNPVAFTGKPITEKPIVSRYSIVNEELQNIIKERIKSLTDVTIEEKIPDHAKHYILSIKRKNCSATVTQFKNGTLLIQGKTNELFDKICSLIEELASPSLNEVVLRFISENEEKLSNISSLLTPELLSEAENTLKSKLGIDLYEFLNEHDKKYALSTFCLELLSSKLNIELPEYTCIVMPLSKAFEGYLKKILVYIGIVREEDFKKKGWSFGKVWRNQEYKKFVGSNKYHQSHLEKLENELDFSRHFIMHSDAEKVARIYSLDEAKEKIDRIAKVMKETFDYFKDHFIL
ncbi:type II toxin-antitoxin system RnlA family toxin [bacterium]|nr:type II toxin-antitoxin system RnlA family toxin [bacterium]